MRYPPARLHICLFVSDKCVWKWCTWWHYRWYYAASCRRIRCSWVLLLDTLQTTARSTSERPARRLPRRLQDDLTDDCQDDFRTTWQATFRSTSRRPDRLLSGRLQDDLTGDFQVDLKTTTAKCCHPCTCLTFAEETHEMKHVTNANENALFTELLAHPWNDINNKTKGYPVQHLHNICSQQLPLKFRHIQQLHE